MATPEEQAIQGVIDQIWDTYDVDKSGELDKDHAHVCWEPPLESAHKKKQCRTKWRRRSIILY